MRRPYVGERTAKDLPDAPLSRILQALAIAIPQLQAIELWRDARGTPHLRGKYVHWRPAGAWLNEDQFSDGTLRLMGLLWAVQDGSGPLLLEEPELSLHPDVVREIPAMFARVARRSGRQILVSTHSTDMLKDPGIGLDETVLLIPEGEGTSIRLANEYENIVALVEGEVSLADAVTPLTRPRLVEQLPLTIDPVRD